MPIPQYLAMTAEEFRCAPSLPEHPAWMACHFSPYSTGLANIPTELPKGAMLILNDRTPIRGHDPERIAGELTAAVTKLDCSRVLLDFQQPDIEETRLLTRVLMDALPCPAAVTEFYAVDGRPVFLPPVPPDTPLTGYLEPWMQHPIWLEIAPLPLQLILTGQGCRIASCQAASEDSGLFYDAELHCHYRIRLEQQEAAFLLQRTREDLTALLAEAEAMHVEAAIGLYQELG